MTGISVAVAADFNRNTYRVDREAAIGREAALSEDNFRAGGDKPRSVDELRKLYDQVDRDELMMAQAAVGLAYGEITYVGGGKIPDDIVAQIRSGVFHSSRAVHDQVASEGKSGVAMFTALNVDSVVRLSAEGPGAGISTYSQFVTSEAQKLDSENAQVIFTGAYGKDRVTHDVNEYIGWLNEAAMKRAASLVRVQSANITSPL